MDSELDSVCSASEISSIGANRIPNRTQYAFPLNTTNILASRLEQITNKYCEDTQYFQFPVTKDHYKHFINGE